MPKTSMLNKINIRHYHTFLLTGVCTICTSTRCMFYSEMGQASESGQVRRKIVSLILNLYTGHVSPQFHVVFDENVSSVPSLKTDKFQLRGLSYAKIIENLLRTKISISQTYGANKIGKVA